jgi:hypothetical protein
MKKLIVTLKDDKLEVYNQPVFIRNKGEAARMMEEMVQDPKSPLSKYPNDFALYEIGTWDEDTGTIQLHENHQYLFRPVDFLREESKAEVANG